MLVGIWAACWWIGRTSLAAEIGQKLIAWSQGLGVALLVGFLGYHFLVPRETEIRWQPFTRAVLEREIAQGKTVFIDFTADWCPTCKWNEWTVLNTPAVAGLVDKNQVVPLVADWTDGSDEIKSILEQLGSNSIPIYAIFTADRPKEPIVLRDLVTMNQVLGALNEAGPSKMTSVAAAGR
jgi:thiol:disulfide interchange protein